MNKRSDLLLALGAALGCAILVASCTPAPTTVAPVGCGAGLSTCGSTCINTTNNVANCGTCGKACASGQLCEAGACVSTCSGATRMCGSSCANISTDPTNCGACGTTCRADQVCTGACVCPTDRPMICNGVCAATCAVGTGGAGTGTGGRAGTGGSTGTGGSVTGTGGSVTGTGGSVTGTGGSVTGTGGSVTGTGGTGTGTGGRGGTTTGTGGGSAGGVSGTPAGWWTSGTWKGCSWTGIDVVASTTTTNMPQDFVTKTASAPYCVSGTVHSTYESVALMGFNLNETPTGVATQCGYKPADPTLTGPPGVVMTGTGLAISFSKNTGSNLRVQIQGPDGGKAGTVGENDRWCYTITEVQGPVFVPFSRFNTKCWDQTGTAFPMTRPISAVVFLVPGLPIKSPFSYCIGGFATGTSVSAAPAYTPTPANPVVTGTIGGPGITDLDFQRVKVASSGAAGKQYILQNNNWGTPAGSDQTIMYSGNSFTIMSTTGNVTGQGVPASFPSIYIGNNGDTQNKNDPPKGVYSTAGNDNLPRQISAITSLNSTFRYNRASGDYNACYDIWVASGAPTSAYDDAISGFVMVWLYRPSGRSPIGSMVRTVTIGTTPYEVWVGPRNSGTNPNRPVVSYVVMGTAVTSKTFDIKPILADAAMHGIPSNWYVTDVFGGFEIWTGSAAAGLQLQEFTAVVQ